MRSGRQRLGGALRSKPPFAADILPLAILFHDGLVLR